MKPPVPPMLAKLTRALPAQRIVLDGEIVVAGAAGFDFAALLERLYPAASRVERVRRQAPASFVAFDVLARGDEDLQDRPFAERRRVLEDVLADARPPLFLTPATRDRGLAAQWLDAFQGGGIEGVMAKQVDLRYQPGSRAMLKVKHDTTTLDGHPWEHGFNLSVSAVGRLGGAVSRWQPGHPLSWMPLAPQLVCEVSYDSLQGDRFRHAPTFRRWRPDRDTASCTFDQFPAASELDLAEIAGSR